MILYIKLCIWAKEDKILLYGSKQKDRESM